MAKMYAIAGEKIYIGNASIADQDADFTESDFSSVTWVEITGWVQRGEFGDQASVVTSDQINRGRTKKAKGTYNAGTMENTFDRNESDAGQALLKTAMADPDNYPIKVVDKLHTGESTAAYAMFIGLVMSSRRSGGSANDPDRIAASIEINSNIVAVAAS